MMQAFSERLAVGKEFEIRASRFLTSVGWPINLYFSAEGQWEFGESAAHVEIKLDNNWGTTGNLFIETRERRDDSGLSTWRAAGIHDASNPWFLLIGDYSKLWLLSIQWLQRMHKTDRYKIVSTPTSEGFLISTNMADRIAIKQWLEW